MPIFATSIFVDTSFILLIRMLLWRCYTIIATCTNNTDCASMCQIGLPACLNGKCVCFPPTAEVETTPLTQVLTPEECISDCDCKIQCQFGHKICHKNICGCIDHPKYTPPICTNS
ncbi:hypothetical protein DCAR_0727116 [Daucus carota subsp. sativus]|uniref:Uncharacterized protein n=1 Tax=Daucus carota subsp. sativus TaxID=79200 RepID=A0AAF0XGL4_DAUCS|nr:hypothetical protein DCAR_0727116 [Daucus carota subsp. sativus]